MKNLLTVILAISITLFAATAFAERGHYRGDYGDRTSYGEKVDRNLDHKGNVIQHRFERKADRAEDKGHYKQANHFRTKGKQISHHLDRKGSWIHARHDRYRHHAKSHRHHVKRVVYRDYTPYKSLYAVVISQPDLWFSGHWRN